mmetsp:Transcript_27909/g.52862  ORF Transcript_27909/g.52862 Transcript_27909/m.52862 type:complete len:147 (-) Transcript_27909:45-485(-)
MHRAKSRLMAFTGSGSEELSEMVNNPNPPLCFSLQGDGVSADVLEVEIRISEPPEVKNNAGYYKVKEGHKFMLSVSSSGMPPPDFQWRLNGVEVEGANGATYLVDKISWGDAGTYTCSVGNAAGKVLWEEAVVDVVLDDEVEGDEL